jgi:hypothetical protein
MLGIKQREVPAIARDLHEGYRQYIQVAVQTKVIKIVSFLDTLFEIIEELLIF